MELSTLLKRMKAILGDEDLIESVRSILFSDRKDDVLSDYVDAVEGDLETDNMQKIFQYYYADRDQKKQDFTPKSIARMCAELTRTNGNTVYDLCAGSGAMTIQKWTKNKTNVFICEELDDMVIPLLIFNMAVRNMDGYVINRDALTMEVKHIYKVSRGKRFSEVVETEVIPLIYADEIISNPPYNIKWDAPEPLLADERFGGKPIPPSSTANYAFVLTAISRMKPEGKCAFVLPNGVLASDNEKEIRAWLVDEGMLEMVISLPNNMFESTSIGTCIMVFSYGNRSVKFYDLRKSATQEQRDQNGQFGGKSHQNRTYHKKINVITDSLIEKLSGECKNTPGLCNEIPNEKIVENGYNLIPSRYIEFLNEEQEHRPYADIIADINRVARERSVIKITCNETLAKQIGIYEAARLESERNDDELNKTFELLEGKYKTKRYIVLTKRKEFKVENQDKEIWSSLINFFIPMWKQHVFYLNQEENRLLAELRDAVLPDLMSGKLKID